MGENKIDLDYVGEVVERGRTIFGRDLFQGEEGVFWMKNFTADSE